MHKIITLLAVVAFSLACGPTADDQQPEPLGALEYEYHGWPGGEWYRLERRVEYVPGEAPWDQPQCGFLTERAHEDLEAAIAALDPSVELGDECYRDDCGYSDCSDAWVHLEGFDHSPFSCDFLCCPAELQTVSWVYFHAANNLSGLVFEIDGEPYAAIEPDQPCP
jgi:hypothetical protein